ncbi:MAG: cytochrome c biogenesis protein CcdA [Candidatus Marinimicrobia bacterium]|nr:cytochrome c biogenesis protein CcdA [Candidatus Neomarinimicrobiota bacterium]MBL7109390.1 cytochrome c biogenesis protein CcdA [Candidatus Neomarinimicrobiota bacterium]
MVFSLTNILLSIGAGIASVASPCVLPVVPIILTGSSEDYKHRPLLIVIGLSVSFIAMGIITSLFAGLIAGKMNLIEKFAGIIVIIMGILMLFNINIFKKITAFNKVESKSTGKWSGLFIGLTLGLIWIPCIGPLLSGVLTMVATEGSIVSGITLLFFYSIGFSIPMLVAGYSSQFFRQKVSFIYSHPKAVGYVSGLILILFGVYILTKGVIAIG